MPFATHPDSALLPAAALLRPAAGQGASAAWPGFWQAAATGLKPAHLHEFHAAEPGDAAAAAGLAAAIAITHSGPTVWLRARRGGESAGVIQGAGWAELGGDPRHCLFVLAQDAPALLRAALDTVRSAAARVVVIEGRGPMPQLDLTASRRLALAASQANVLLLLLRSEADLAATAAWTRWAVASAPSRPLEANAPGLPCFDLELLRHRAGPAGARWHLEWDRDRREFRQPGEPALSGAVVPVPSGAALAAGSGRSGRRAA